MARLLLVGPDRTPQDRAVLTQVHQAVTAFGHEARLAEGDASARIRQLDQCDGVVAVLDHADARTWLLLGQARATRRPVAGLRSDAQETFPDAAADLLVRTEAWTVDALRPQLQSFLARVRVFAGTLVRDAVPKLLEEEGKVLSFRTVAPAEYPAVLKRKLVETARRLEEADFGVEQEEIADFLELLETLINLRKYDKESLRSIKEGKWRKRGGFERGFLLQEEPVTQSR